MIWSLKEHIWLGFHVRQRHVDNGVAMDNHELPTALELPTMVKGQIREKMACKKRKSKMGEEGVLTWLLY